MAKKTVKSKAPQATKRRVPPRTIRAPGVKGNDFWRRRSSHGRKPKFANAEDLLDACCQYFADTIATPLEIPVHRSVGGVLEWVVEERPRPFTLDGMCIFIGVAYSTWASWKQQNGDHYRDDLSEVIAYAEQVCRNQAFELAAAGLCNANIIARYLGLADKKDHSSTDGTMTPAPTEIRLIGVRANHQEEGDA